MNYIDLKDRPLCFADLLKKEEMIAATDWPGDHKIQRVVWHSGAIEKGDLFLAIPPLDKTNDGSSYLHEAIDRKAAIIIKEKNVQLERQSNSTIIVDVNDARGVRALMAQRLFPGQPGKVVGVTGTNGKTSVVHFCRQIWEMMGYKALGLGTFGYQSSVDLGSLPEYSINSPDPFILHQILAAAKKAGITHLALEASSHGLDQHRLDGVSFVSAGFTNLTHDHLDYHGDMDTYYKAKARFFVDLLPPGETAVLNADTNYYQPLAKLCKEKGIHILSYGKRSADGICLENLTIEGATQIAHISIARCNYHLRLNFIGKFQVLNALCALGLLVGSGENPETIIPYLEKLKPVPGRLELMGITKSGGAVYVDYAHTPDALQEALLSVRPYVSGILTVLFGCGGDRDSAKRPIMGKLAGQYSDAQIITDDNPRGEDPVDIRHAILRFCTNAQEIPDRYEAIKRSILRLGKNDAVLIAGKGHEQFQLVKNEKIPFDDRQIARDILIESGGSLAA